MLTPDAHGLADFIALKDVLHRHCGQEMSQQCTPSGGNESQAAHRLRGHPGALLRTIRVELGRLPGHDNSIERRERAAQLLRRGRKSVRLWCESPMLLTQDKSAWPTRWQACW